MRRWPALLALIAVSAVATPGVAASLSDTGRPASPHGQAPIRQPDLLVPLRPTVAPATPRTDMTDRNGNRVADGLETRLSAASAAERLNVIVRFATAGDADAARQRLGAIGLRRHFDLVHGFSATVTPGQARLLAQMP